jgi:hypothetical protein
LTIKEHIIANLDVEMEAKFAKGNTYFLVDIYKYNSPNEAYDNFEKLSSFKITSAYRDKTDYFKRYSTYTSVPKEDGYSLLKPIKTDFQFKSYLVQIDDSGYINHKRNFDELTKTLFLVYNLVIVIYDYTYTGLQFDKVTDSSKIFGIIQDYVFSKQ